MEWQDSLLIVGRSYEPLEVYDIRTWKLVANSLEKLFVRNIYVDSAENAWIASIGSGILLLHPKSIHAGHVEFVRLPPPFDPYLHSEFRAIVEDKKKNIWMASVNSGLVKYNPHSGAFSHITTEQGLASNTVFSLCCDKEDNLWIGTNSGLQKLVHKDVLFYSSKQGLPADLVLDLQPLPGNSAIMVPHTPDGRVLFAVPWHDHVVVGTTDVGVDTVSLEPVPMDEEIGFILTNAAKYLSKPPSRGDVLSVYAGLRPLVKVGDSKSTAALSRDHTILIPNAGLLTIAGGKRTTYRKMAQDAVEQAETMAGLEERPCKTEHLQIHGWTRQAIPEPSLRIYGADAPAIQEIASKEPALAEKFHSELPYIGAEVVWAVRAEMARTVEDVLARRTRALLLGARASIEAAPRVAELMARELKRDGNWQKQSVQNFNQVAQGYVLPA